VGPDLPLGLVVEKVFGTDCNICFSLMLIGKLFLPVSKARTNTDYIFQQCMYIVYLQCTILLYVITIFIPLFVESYYFRCVS
jgi:hypothetical protein